MLNNTGISIWNRIDLYEQTEYLPIYLIDRYSVCSSNNSLNNDENVPFQFINRSMHVLFFLFYRRTLSFVETFKSQYNCVHPNNSSINLHIKYSNFLPSNLRKC